MFAQKGPTVSLKESLRLRARSRAAYKCSAFQTNTFHKVGPDVRGVTRPQCDPCSCWFAPQPPLPPTDDPMRFVLPCVSRVTCWSQAICLFPSCSIALGAPACPPAEQEKDAFLSTAPFLITSPGDRCSAPQCSLILPRMKVPSHCCRVQPAFLDCQDASMPLPTQKPPPNPALLQSIETSLFHRLLPLLPGNGVKLPNLCVGRRKPSFYFIFSFSFSFHQPEFARLVPDLAPGCWVLASCPPPPCSSLGAPRPGAGPSTLRALSAPWSLTETTDWRKTTKPNQKNSPKAGGAAMLPENAFLIGGGGENPPR